MLTKLEPLGDKLIIELKKPDEVTESGIIIPGNATDKPTEGTVLAIGDDDKLRVKVGDQVLFSKYSGTELEYEGKSMMIMSQRDILAIIR